MAIRRYQNMPESEKHIEENICNYAQDIVLLWHLKDSRVRLADN